MSTAERAVNIAVSIADGADVTGVINVEFLLDVEQRPYVDRIMLGPLLRPHQISDGASASRFENHLRAVLDWPLRTTTMEALSPRPTAPPTNL